MEARSATSILEIGRHAYANVWLSVYNPIRAYSLGSVSALIVRSFYMAAEDYFSALHCSETDQREFEYVVGEYFGHGRLVGAQEIYHARTGGGCALRLQYDDNGKLTKILAGADLEPGQIEELQKKIEKELLSAAARKVRRHVLFAVVPTVGFFRYKGVFQIVPVPPEAPRPKQILGEHPFFLEFALGISSNFAITNLRHAKTERQLELALSSILAYHITSIGPTLQQHWSIDLVGDTIVLPSKFLQEGYSWNGAVLEIDDFSSTQGLPALETVDLNTYYSTRGISVDQKLNIPSDAEDQLDHFFALSVDNREKFLRASYWFQHADVVFNQSRSASFIALVSAIEALMPPPKGGKQCTHCKQMLGIGPTKQFIDFVEALIPDASIPESERKRFYRARSALSHGGKLLANDHGVWGFTPRQLGEGQDADMVWRIAQAVLHNWLIRT